MCLILQTLMDKDWSLEIAFLNNPNNGKKYAIIWSGERQEYRTEQYYKLEDVIKEIEEQRCSTKKCN